MTTGQILWGLNSFLFVVCFFFVRVWIFSLGKAIDKMESKLGLKLDAITCLERHGAMDKNCNNLFKHKHAPAREDGTGGEVIIP